MNHRICSQVCMHNFRLNMLLHFNILLTDGVDEFRDKHGETLRMQMFTYGAQMITERFNESEHESCAAGCQSTGGLTFLSIDLLKLFNTYCSQGFRISYDKNPHTDTTSSACIACQLISAHCTSPKCTLPCSLIQCFHPLYGFRH